MTLKLLLSLTVLSTSLFAALGKHEVQVTKTPTSQAQSSKASGKPVKDIKAPKKVDKKKVVESTKKVSSKEPADKKKEGDAKSPEVSTSSDALKGATGAASLAPTRSTSQSNLPIPRFVCIKAGEANMHVGPGNTYPVEWKYVRKFLPVEVIAEFEHWRQVRDAQGTVGWLHKSLLSSKRFVMVQNKVVNLYTGADLESPVIATVEPGVIGKVSECFQSLCKIDIQGVKGWVKREFLWGVYPDEAKF